MNKTAMQWLENYLNQKVLPCPEGNDYVYGMNVAHENLINYVIPALLEKEKEQMFEYVKHSYIVPSRELEIHKELFDQWYNQTYNQNK